MTLPYQFPDPREEAYRRAQEFQRLTSTQRWSELAAMMTFGWEMVDASPNRAAIELRMADQEAKAQIFQRKFFERNGH